MALKNGKPNPLNLLGLRRVDFPARHFYYTTLDPNKIQLINDWIFNNLNGIYYLGRKLILDHTNSIQYALTLGFEEEKELSFFLLSYSDL
jgi:hypothetical protein